MSRAGTVCVEFAYHMYGSRVGQLVLRTSDSDRALWERSGSQGNEWQRAMVTMEIRSGDQV